MGLAKRFSDERRLVTSASFRRPPVYRKYELREDYFDKIDSAEKAYFLGLLYADGNVAKGNFRIELTGSDKPLLERFRDAIYLDSNRPLYRVRGKIKQWGQKRCRTRLGYCLAVFSSKIADALIKHGCGPKKTDVIRFPFGSLPEQYYRDFIRGYFDGDGCITSTHSKYKKSVYTQYTLSFCANDDFGRDLFDVLDKMGFKFFINKYVLTIVSTSDKMTIHRFYNQVWYDGCLCLERKRLKLESFQHLFFRKLGSNYYPNTRREGSRWVASVGFDKHKYYLGSFVDREEAFLVAQSFKESVGIL